MSRAVSLFPLFSFTAQKRKTCLLYYSLRILWRHFVMNQAYLLPSELINLVPCNKGSQTSTLSEQPKDPSGIMPELL